MRYFIWFAAILIFLLLFSPALAREPAVPLPEQILMKQWIANESWLWTLNLRPNGKVYDAVARKESTGAESKHTFDIKRFDGKNIVLYRPDAGTYTGKVSQDGATASGSTNFAGLNEGWMMTFGRNSSLPVPMDVIDPNRAGIRYRVENFVFKSPDAYVNPRNLHDYIVNFDNCTVQSVAVPTAHFDIHVCRANTRLTFTQIIGSSSLDYDWILQDGGARIAGAWRQGANFGPSVGASIR